MYVTLLCITTHCRHSVELQLMGTAYPTRHKIGHFGDEICWYTVEAWQMSIVLGHSNPNPNLIHITDTSIQCPLHQHRANHYLYISCLSDVFTLSLSYIGCTLAYITMSRDSTWLCFFSRWQLDIIRSRTVVYKWSEERRPKGVSLHVTQLTGITLSVTNIITLCHH